MPVQVITNIPKPQTQPKRVNYVQLTGYGATALGVASAIAGANKKITLHKQLAYLAGIITAAHIGIIEYFHHKKSAN